MFYNFNGLPVFSRWRAYVHNISRPCFKTCSREGQDLTAGDGNQAEAGRGLEDGIRAPPCVPKNYARPMSIEIFLTPGVENTFPYPGPNRYTLPYHSSFYTVGSEHLRTLGQKFFNKRDYVNSVATKLIIVIIVGGLNVKLVIFYDNFGEKNVKRREYCFSQSQ